VQQSATGLIEAIAALIAHSVIFSTVSANNARLTNNVVIIAILQGAQKWKSLHRRQILSLKMAQRGMPQ